MDGIYSTTTFTIIVKRFHFRPAMLVLHEPHLIFFWPHFFQVASAAESVIFSKCDQIEQVFGAYSQ